MANFVIKRNGIKEPFNAEKIKSSILAATQRTELSEERKNQVVEQVLNAVVQLAEQKEEIATLELREKILSELDMVEPSISEAWRKHDQEKE